MPDKTEEVKPETETETVEKPQDSKPPEKMLPQSEVTKLMEDARKKHRAELSTLQGEFDAFKKQVSDKEKAANEAAEEKVAKLRKDLPESIGVLLDKLSPIDQLEWLSDPANTITKKQIPDLPEPRLDADRTRKAQVII